MFTHNFSGTKESGYFPPVPDGEYLLKVVKAEEKKTQNGRPMVSVQLKITDGEHAGRVVFHNVTFMAAEDSGSGMAMRWLHGLGEPYTGKITVEPRDWIGKIVKCSLVTEEYRGKKKNSISEVFISKDDTLVDNPDTGDAPF